MGGKTGIAGEETREMCGEVRGMKRERGEMSAGTGGRKWEKSEEQGGEVTKMFGE